MRKKAGVLKIISGVLCVIASVITTLFAVLLAITAFLNTSSANNMEEQIMLYTKDNLLVNGIVYGVALALIILLSKKLSENSLFVKRMFYIAMGWLFAGGILLVLFGRTMPSADPYVVYSMGQSAANGDLSFVDPTDSYMSYYPQQIGITTFFAMIFKIISVIQGSHSGFHFIKAIYCVLNCVAFYFQYKLVKNIFQNDRVNVIFSMISMLNLPFIMYSSYVYSEIPSFAAMMAGTWFMYKFAEKKNNIALNMTISALLFAISVFLRKNSLIMIIAVIIVVILKFLATKKAYLIIYGAMVLVLSLSILPVTIKIYEKAAGSTIAEGVTMYSYVAMGMQEAGRGPGWYNGFNFNTYQETGMDQEKANEISSEKIKERMTYFKENPTYAKEFYIKKYLSQWTDPTLASCQATWADGGGRAQFVYEIYNGKYNKLYIFICNLFQNLVCIGAAIYGICKTVDLLKKNSNKDVSFEYLFMIAIFGGFLFHMFWEANSRYILVYAMMLVPYGAAGYGRIFGFHNTEK